MGDDVMVQTLLPKTYEIDSRLNLLKNLKASVYYMNDKQPLSAYEIISEVSTEWLLMVMNYAILFVLKV
jgi:hypothetical protein